MKLNFKTVVIPALILCLICLSVSALLGLTNMVTKDKIAEAQKKTEEDSRLLVLSDAESFEISDDESYYMGLNGGEHVGYVFVTESKGYGGTVSVMTGIGADGEIKGVVILSQNETPGLGANATNEKFTDQYKQTAQKLEVVKNTPSGDGKIEAMTGATITTNAVTEAVNKAIEIYETVKGGK